MRPAAAPEEDGLAPDRRGQRRPAAYVLIVAASVAFGAGDQYLGSLFSPLATTFSLMSAPWLLLPFVAGCTQVRARRAASLGLAVTLAAVAGYIVMIVSPVEGVHLTWRVLGATAWSQVRWLAAGVISGPVYGLLGQRWRTRRSWLSALLAISPLLFEPLTRVFRLEWGEPLAYVIEVTAGLAAAGYFAVAITRSGRQPAS